MLIEFLESVCSTSRTVIMSGDFNFVEDLSLDKRTPLPLSRTRGNSRVETFVNFRSFFNLYDPFRFLHPMRVEFSHRQTVYGGVSFSRLDRYYVSSVIVQEIASISHKFCPHSDHFYVHMETNILTNNKCPTGSGYWYLVLSCIYIISRYDYVKTGFVGWVWYNFIIIISIKHGLIVYPKVFGCQVWMKGLLVCFVYRIEWEVLFGQRVADDETLNAIYWF